MVENISINICSETENPKNATGGNLPVPVDGKEAGGIPRYVLFFVSYTWDEIVRGFTRLLPQSSNLTTAFWHKK